MIRYQAVFVCYYMVCGLMFSHHLLYLLEQIRCEDKFV